LAAVTLAVSLAVTTVAGFVVFAPPGSPGSDRVSALGRYKGYSHPEYNGWRRESHYVPVRDGTLLAVDIYRPTFWGVPALKRLPVLWSDVRYYRAKLDRGQTELPVERMARYQKFLKHGYVLAFVDIRGTGASLGVQDGPFSEAEANDAYDITEWLARQPWSNGRIGMFGTSYMGTNQYFAAARRPPSLKAIFPEKAMFDLYDFARPGGILREDFGRQWSELVGKLDREVLTPPVSADRDLRERARRDHARNRNAFDMLAPLAYRDSVDAISAEQIFAVRSPGSQLDAINTSGIAIYHLAGWLDMWPRDALLWFANLKVPHKLVIGPWSHIGTENFDNFAEHLRWYDYWLKGIDNGVMAEAPIWYFTAGAPPGREWRSTNIWPLPNEKRVNFFFCPSASLSSDGRDAKGLCSTPPPAGSESVDLDTNSSSGPNTRWSNGYGSKVDYQGLAQRLAGGKSLMSAPLTHDIEVTGHPVIRIWLATTQLDLDIIAYLGEVDAAGGMTYLTEGALRASHRAVQEPPYKRFGLPYHRGVASDMLAWTPEPFEMAFDLHPISRIFAAGSRIWVMLTGADVDNLERRPITPDGARVRIFCGADHPSALDLPVIDAGRGP
jgi:putative CocE/NonD family hydrolase